MTLSAPKALGGSGAGTNPEQLFAAGYAACFQSALGTVGRKQGVDVSASTVEAVVGLGRAGIVFGLTVDLTATIPGVDAETAQELVEAAHHVCPYSNATRGNVPVTVTGLAG